VQLARTSRTGEHLLLFLKHGRRTLATKAKKVQCHLPSAPGRLPDCQLSWGCFSGFRGFATAKWLPASCPSEAGDRLAVSRTQILSLTKAPGRIPFRQRLFAVLLNLFLLHSMEYQCLQAQGYKKITCFRGAASASFMSCCNLFTAGKLQIP
jgi:hypothetical protein